MRCSYYNFGFNLGYINNKSLNNYVNQYNTATSYSWGNTSLMYGMNFSLGYCLVLNYTELYSPLNSPSNLLRSFFDRERIPESRPAARVRDAAG